MEQTIKHLQYAVMLNGKIAELFDEDSESDFHIDQQELQEGDNLTHFFHALANIMPTYLFNKITGDDKNNLEFNHIANQLVFQYYKKQD
jgi:ribosomal protein L2